MAVYIGLTILVVAATASLDEAAQTAISLSVFLLTLVGGPILIETLTHGKSLGKLACGLRVVRDDGGPIRFRHSLVRGLIGVIEILMTLGVVACTASLVSARGRRLGDVFAGTLVVRERVPAARSGYVPPPPPWLAGRFQGLDLSAVPDGLWLAVRQYLTRMGQLDPQVGSAMAQRLASDLADRTGTPVPPGVHPAAYLAAVLQERQAREARRAFGNGAAAGGRPGGMAAGPTGPPAPPPLPRPRRPRRRVRRNRRTDRRPAAPAEGSSRLPSRAGGLRRVQDPAGQGNTDGGDSRSSSSMPGAERTTSPARCTGCCSPVSRAVTWYSSTVRGPLSVACASLFTRAQDWSTVRGARTGSVKATRRTRVADAEGVRRRSRAVATRKAGDEP